MKRFVLKNPATGKYWNGCGSYKGSYGIRYSLGPRDSAYVYTDLMGIGSLSQDLMDIGALVREYLPDPPKYRVFIRTANGDKLFYGRLYSARGFWTEEHYAHSNRKNECYIITWDSINDIPIELREIEASDDYSAGYLFFEREG